MWFWQTGVAVWKMGYNLKHAMAKFQKEWTTAWVQDGTKLGHHSIGKDLWLRKDWKPGMNKPATNKVILPLNTDKDLAECCT